MKTLLTLSAVLLAALAGSAQPPDAPKKDWPFTGTWTKAGGEGVDLTFSFQKKDQFLLTAVVGEAELKATCEYEFDKPKNRVKAKVTKVEAVGDFPESLEKGFKMAFTLKVDEAGKFAKLTDYEAENADQVKDIVEGEYRAKKAD